MLKDHREGVRDNHWLLSYKEKCALRITIMIIQISITINQATQ